MPDSDWDPDKPVSGKTASPGPKGSSLSLQLFFAKFFPAADFHSLTLITPRMGRTLCTDRGL